MKRTPRPIRMDEGPYITTGEYDRKIDGPPQVTTRLVAGVQTIAYFQRRHEAESVARKLEAFDGLLKAAKALLHRVEDYRDAGCEDFKDLPEIPGAAAAITEAEKTS
jgi:hypothetical protein